jgi:hypothetical protein
MQGVSALDGINDVLPRKSPLPLRVINTLKRPCSRPGDRKASVTALIPTLGAVQVSVTRTEMGVSVTQMETRMGGAPLATTSESDVLV